ncbi:hypothetical protein C5167_011300 [Papaver somniferum]|uniref:Uncharacterized protein n=1 Tax=Papaver somniferum TaxID=3469 RepID=A0A4Y7K6P7_PAPSO|nr:hypothetical protein C5167_011300 [Papaver somniferum]
MCNRSCRITSNSRLFRAVTSAYDRGFNLSPSLDTSSEVLPDDSIPPRLTPPNHGNWRPTNAQSAAMPFFKVQWILQWNQ